VGSQAEDLLRSSIAKLKLRPGGRSHESAATAINNLAFLLKTEGRYDEALDLYTEALEIRTEVLGEMHPDTIISKSNLAELYRKMGNEAAALELQREILATLEATPGGATADDELRRR
jgi:tetratricopeptide (TPR) repeat protein